MKKLATVSSPPFSSQLSPPLSFLILFLRPGINMYVAQADLRLGLILHQPFSAEIVGVCCHAWLKPLPFENTCA